VKETVVAPGVSFETVLVSDVFVDGSGGTKSCTGSGATAADMKRRQDLRRQRASKDVGDALDVVQRELTMGVADPHARVSCGTYPQNQACLPPAPCRIGCGAARRELPANRDFPVVVRGGNAA
jgi:hypothetical protein